MNIINNVKYGGYLLFFLFIKRPLHDFQRNTFYFYLFFF